MKKILFLFLIVFIKLNAWELICRDYVSSTQTAYQYYYDLNSNTIKFQGLYNGQGTVSATDPYKESYFWQGFYNVHDNNGRNGYRTKANLRKQLKSNLIMLDAFYRLAPQVILNFYYNPNRATLQEHIEYTNYQLLYNEDGLIVESIVGGVWQGLYDSPENSGLLYDKANNILYDNGHLASLFQKFWYNLTGNTGKTLKLYYISMLSINVFILILAVYLVKVLLKILYRWCSQLIRNTRINVNLGAQKRW